MTALLWLLVALPAVAGGLLLAGQASAERLAVPVALTVAAGTVVLAVLVSVGRPTAAAPFLAGAAFGLRVDGLAALVLVVVAVVALAVLLASLAEIEQSRARFYGLMLVFLAAVLVTVTASSLLSLLFAWELMGATSYALIAFRWREGEAVGSGTTAFLTTRAGDLGLYAAAGAALAGSGSLSLDRLPELTGWPLHLAAAGLLAAALGKAAQLPFSFWLARAMQGPSTVSALLHSAAMVAMGGYLLLRVQPLLAAAGWAEPVTAWLGVTTAVLLGVVALGQSDLKLLLAASTASQLGFVVLAAGVAAVPAGAAHLVGHAFVKSTLFLAAGAWLDLLGTRDLSRLRGASRRLPAVGVVFTVAALALAGLAPLSLWATKDDVLAAALHRSVPLYLAGLLAAVLAGAYTGRVVALLLRPPPDRAVAPALPRLAWVPLVPLAAVAAAGGSVALPPVRRALGRVLAVTSGPAPRAWELLLSAGLAAAAFALAWARAESLPRAVPAAVRDWLRLEAAAWLLMVRPVLRLAQALALFDDHVLGGGIDALAPAGRTVATAARRLDERGVDAVVRGVARQTRRLGARAVRPQTGQVHQYLAQASVVLAAAALLLALRR